MAGAKTYYWNDVEFLGPSDYCATEVKHLDIPAEVASAIYLTITNIDSTSICIEIESANNDTVDFLLITGGSGAMISDQDTSVAGKIKRTLTWMTPPSDVTLNVLWSKESFGGNWQLSPMDITVPFSAECPTPQKDQINLPVTFEDTANVDYDLVDFGGNASMIIVDPTDPSNLVAQSIKTDMAELWAGTTMGNSGFANPIPFTADDTRMQVRVWSPDTNIPVRLKVEDATNAAISVETEVNTTVAMTWDTLVFDFTQEVAGTPALNLANTYSKASIFFNFGTTGAMAGQKTYYWDDVEFLPGGGGPMKDQIDLPVTFEDTATVDYDLVDFGGNASMIIVDPTDPNNLVAQSIKTDMAELWAGTTMGNSGFANPIPFTADDTRMQVRVWSPDANIPIRLKVEDATNRGYQRRNRSKYNRRNGVGYTGL